MRSALETEREGGRRRKFEWVELQRSLPFPQAILVLFLLSLDSTGRERFCPLASAGSLKPIPDVEVRKKLLRRSDEQRAVTREGAKAEAGRREGDEYGSGRASSTASAAARAGLRSRVL